MSAHHPRLRVKAGPSLSKLSPVAVNSAVPLAVSDDDGFEGEVTVRIVDYLGPADDVKGSTLPEVPMHDGTTWSIALRVKWDKDMPADDIMWGNTWQHPIRDSLPYGTAAVLRFVHLVDPALSQDVYADQPWALSPMIATMNFARASKDPNEPKFNGQVEEDLAALFDEGHEGKEWHGDPKKRKAFFNDAQKRQSFTIPASTSISTDFCNGYIDFKTLSLKLPIGLSFALEKYWDGQPVTFVLRNRDGSKQWLFVTFEIVKEDGSKAVSTEETPKQDVANSQDNLGVDKQKVENAQDDLGVD